MLIQLQKTCEEFCKNVIIYIDKVYIRTLYLNRGETAYDLNFTWRTGQ